jgi:hypothetical protein
MLTIQFISFINHVLELFTQRNGSWNLMKQRNSIFFCYLNTFTFLKGKNMCMKMIKNELSILSFGQKIYKILNLKSSNLCNISIKHGLNIIHSFMIP